MQGMPLQRSLSDGLLLVLCILPWRFALSLMIDGSGCRIFGRRWPVMI
jgi:hypothetical protein